ncbi:hypothetical protein D9M68_582160 [compost metagenome]
MLAQVDGQPDRAGLHAGQVQRDQDMRRAVQRHQVGLVVDLHPAAHLRFAAGPEDAALGKAAEHGAEALARQLVDLGLGLVREAQAQVGLHHAAAFAGNQVEQAAQPFAEAGNERIWQLAQHRQQADAEPGEHAAHDIDWSVVGSVLRLGAAGPL